MCLMNSVRWSDWTRKATERSSETTQREVDGTMWRAPERERGSGVTSWARRRRAEEEGACEFSRERKLQLLSTKKKRSLWRALQKWQSFSTRSTCTSWSWTAPSGPATCTWRSTGSPRPRTRRGAACPWFIFKYLFNCTKKKAKS